jgi:hypothetical protein
MAARRRVSLAAVILKTVVWALDESRWDRLPIEKFEIKIGERHET